MTYDPELPINHPDHDHDHPDNEPNLTRTLALMYGDHRPRCDECELARLLVAGPGTAWDIELYHEKTCSQHEDNQPAVEVDATGDLDYAATKELERMWRANTDES